jgi:hypothetical protein
MSSRSSGRGDPRKSSLNESLGGIDEVEYTREWFVVPELW